MRDTEEQISIEGEIEDVIFQSDDTGYTVCEIAWDGEMTTLVGTLAGVMVGDFIRAMGHWTNHPTYGKQFKVAYFEKNAPQDQKAMLRYLSSRAIKGIGPRLAERIVDLFGDSTFDVMENNPDLLSDVPGISPKKARQISEAFREQFGARQVMMFFGAFFGPGTSLRIYKRYGSGAVDLVQKNPYRLCEEVHGIGFEKADAMAKSLGMDNTAAPRLGAGLRFVLKKSAATQGNVYLPRRMLVSSAAAVLQVSEDKVEKALEELIRAGELYEVIANEDRPVYLPQYFLAQSGAAAKLVSLSRVDLFGSVDGADDLIARTEEREGIHYDPVQRRAIRSAIDHPVTVLTGGPGTGKTTIIKAIVNIFHCVGMETALAAPTGRAAKRMSESTGFSAKTIHRLLEMEYSPGDDMTFTRNERNPLSFDAVIIDEVSMVDLLLFDALLKALRPGCRLILIGDSDQLPSVGAGNVLQDTIECGVFCVCRLQHIFRQSHGSDIVENAHRINRGKEPVPSDKSGDFFFLSRSTPDATAAAVVSLCTERLPKTYGDNVRDRIQVISCTRKGEIGTAHLNVLLQKALNPPSMEKREKRIGEIIFREGDKVMQMRNNYDLEWTDPHSAEQGFGVFNGDIGRITQVDEVAESVLVTYDGKEVVYSFEELSEIEHAFAVTVHKSQGSEYPVLIFPVLNPPPMLASRRLLYTGVTRAKEMAILVGSSETVRNMVRNDRKDTRFSGLADAYRTFADQA